MEDVLKVVGIICRYIMAILACVWFIEFLGLIGQSSEQSQELAGAAIGKAVICGAVAAIWFYRASKTKQVNKFVEYTLKNRQSAAPVQFNVTPTPLPTQKTQLTKPPETDPEPQEIAKMVCRACGKEFADEFKFCPYCGDEKFASCPECGKESSIEFSYCPYCGEAFAPEPSVIESPNPSPEINPEVNDLTDQTAQIKSDDPDKAKEIGTYVFGAFSAICLLVSIMKGLVPIYLFEAVGWAGAAWYWHSKKTHSELAKAIVIVLAVLVAIGEVIHITWQAGMFSTSNTPKITAPFEQYAVPAGNSGSTDYSIYGTADRNQAGASAVTQDDEIERQAVALFDQKQYKKAKPLFEQACKGGVVEACNKLHDGLLTGEHATNPRLTESLPINGFTGKYSGMVRNITEGLSTTFTVSLRESKDGYIEGCMTVEPPLGGSGYLKGQVQDSKFSFDVVGALSQISFTGQRDANNLSGTYLVSFPEGTEQNGSFSLHRVSLDFPNSGFSSTSCPDDSAILTPAAEQGNTAAQEYLAAMYYLGRGVPKDYSKAHKLFTTACDGGDQKACDILRKKF